MLVGSVRRAVAVVMAVRVAEMEGREAPESRRVVRRGVEVGEGGVRGDRAGGMRGVGVEKFMVGEWFGWGGGLWVGNSVEELVSVMLSATWSGGDGGGM